MRRGLFGTCETHACVLSVEMMYTMSSSSSLECCLADGGRGRWTRGCLHHDFSFLDY